MTQVSDERLAAILHHCSVDNDSWTVSNAEMQALAAELQSLRSAREAKPVKMPPVWKALYLKQSAEVCLASDVKAHLHFFPSTEGLGVRVPDNLHSHRASWLKALERLIELEPESVEPDMDEKGYWRHERQAMLDMYANLDTLSALSTSAEEVGITDENGFVIGEPVEKFTGEARWEGILVASYLTTTGHRRYVVEVKPQGFQMIAVPAQLRMIAALSQSNQVKG